MPAFPISEPGHYHLSVHTVSKLNGNSVVAMAAYRHAELFRSATNSVTHAAAYQRAQELGNDGKVFDYRRKIGVAWTGIMAPAPTPKELLDPQTLWNTVERIESRKNARLAREMIIALPHQVDLDIHIAMLRAFVGTHLLPRGMIADVAIHKPPIEHGGDPRNWHAHVLLTDRPITAQGFAAKKDPTWNAKESLLLWRKAWADTHNATMEHLGLPHRIDHRSLEAQRNDALARGDTIAALDLDREPQIHVGKALHTTHPRHTIYADRRTRNEAILTRNKHQASIRADRMRSQIANADNAAYLEARVNAYQRDTWQPEPATLDEMRATYGRQGFTNELLARNIRTQAATIAATHTWLPKYADDNEPGIMAFLMGEVATRKPGHPVFSVSARDLAFVFYTWGLTTLAGLHRTLQNIAEEEALRHPKAVKKFKPRPPLPKRPPPTLPTPKAELLARLRSFAPVPENIYLKRLAQLHAFQARHQRRQQQLAASQSKCLARPALYIQRPDSVVKSEASRSQASERQAIKRRRATSSHQA
jgi:hypothetical protein